MKAQPHLEDALRFARLLLAGRRVVELRVPKPGPVDGRRPLSGFYDDAQALVRDAVRLSERGAVGVYATLNDVTTAAVRARAEGRMNAYRRAASGDASADADVTRRCWLPVDADPERPKHTSATDAELEAAMQRTAAVRDYLAGMGMPAPVEAMSGNGGHLVYRVDLPADSPLVALLLGALSKRFSDDAVKVDTTVSNASRIWKIPGTVARKGDDMPERPHRTARLVSVPEPLEVADEALLSRVLREIEASDAAPQQERSPAPAVARPSRPVGASASNRLPDSGPWSEEEVRELLRCVPYARPPYSEGGNGGALDYPWLKLISATLDAVGGNARAAERLLVERWPEDEPGEYARKLADPGASKTSRATLIYYAKEGGWRGSGNVYDGGRGPASTVTDSREQGESEDAAPAEQGRKSVATLLVDLMRETGAELWHDAEGEPFVTFALEQRREHHRLRTRAVRDQLSRLYYTQKKKVAGDQAIQDALSTLAGEARFDGKQYETALRVAEDEGGIWIDLGSDTWDVVRITPGAWSVIPGHTCPVRFIRRKGMLPIPTPVKGGSVDELRRFLNVDTSGEDFTLLLAWTVQALRRRGSYPVLAFGGEAGSGKTTAARILRSLTDPNVAQVRSLPRSEQDLFISATSSHVLAFDNASGVPLWLSDALCRVSTGAANVGRELYTSDEERILEAKAPVILTAIADVVGQQDLVDRTISVTLRRIPDSERQTERELYDTFEQARPRLFGALVDAVAEGLRREGSVVLREKPRLADFALWATACEPGLGLDDGAFMRAFNAGRASLIESALEGDPVADALRAFAESRHEAGFSPIYEGTSSDLLELLAERSGYGDSGRKPPKEWPRRANVLTSRLKTLASGLRAVGIELDFLRKAGGARTRQVLIQKSAAKDRPHRPDRPAPAKSLPQQAKNGDLRGDGGSSPHRPGIVPPSSRSSPHRPAENGDSRRLEPFRDDRDDRDDETHNISDPADPTWYDPELNDLI